MLRNRKLNSGRCSPSILTFVLGMASWAVIASDDIPVGHQADRYQPVWERNPFTLVTPVHKSSDPKLAEVVLSNGTEEGSVKFRTEVAATAPQQNVPAAPTAGAQNPVVPGGAGPAIMSRQAQAAQNGQQVSRLGANQQGVTQMQSGPGTVPPPRASEARRKRITPPPVVEQPVGVPVPVQNVPSPVQPQTQ
jgi:hypothetical protein